MDWYHLLADNDKFFTSLGNIAVFVQAVFFILSIYFIWRQLRETRRQIQENTDLTRAANKRQQAQKQRKLCASEKPGPAATSTNS